MDPRFSRPTRRRRMPGARALVPAVFALVLLSGFGAQGGNPGAAGAGETTKVRSGSQAVEAQSFVPPPRTVSDITAILDAQKLDDPGDWKRDLRSADRKPPEDADPRTLARFYYKRGRAAQMVGRAAQAIADLTRAHRFGDQLSVRRRLRILFHLGLTEGNAGNRAKGIEYLREGITLSERSRRPSQDKARFHGRLASVLASEGKIGEAKRQLALADKLIESLGHSVAAYRRRGAEILKNTGLGSLLKVKGRVFLSTGNYRKAEAAFRAAIDYHARDQKTNRVNYIRSVLAMALSAQGRHVEAEVEVRHALLYLLRKFGRNHRRTGARVRKLAGIIEAQGRIKEAEKLYRASLDIASKVSSAPGSRDMIAVRVGLGDNLARQNRWADALAQFDSAQGAAKDKALLDRYVHGNPEYALVLIRDGRLADGLAVARRSADRALKIYGKDHVRTATARGIAAISFAALGRDREALRTFSRSSAVLLAHLTRGRADPQRVATDWRIKTVLEGYMRLLARTHGTPLEAESGFIF